MVSGRACSQLNQRSVVKLWLERKKNWAGAPSTGGHRAREHVLCRTGYTSCFRLFHNHIWSKTLSDQSHPQRWRHCREGETRSPLQTCPHPPCPKALDLESRQVLGNNHLDKKFNRHPSTLDVGLGPKHLTKIRGPKSTKLVDSRTLCFSVL